MFKLNLFFSTFSKPKINMEFNFILALSPNIICPSIFFSFSVPQLLNEVSLWKQMKKNLILVLIWSFNPRVNIASTWEVNVYKACAWWGSFLFSYILCFIYWLGILILMHLISCTDKSIMLKRTRTKLPAHLKYNEMTFSSTSLILPFLPKA